MTSSEVGGNQPDVLDVLSRGELTVEGRVVAASNLTLYARVDGDSDSLSVVYKPVSGERPLWDFPDGTLAARERAAYLVSSAGGWHVVPPTVLRDGPLGPGMVQQWVTATSDVAWVDLVADEDADRRGWLTVLRGQDQTGRAVCLMHRDDAALRGMALLDALLNNADRKGGHVLSGPQGAPLGVDHGLCFHVEPKLRTVLWGWHGEPLSEAERTHLAVLDTWLSGPGTADLDPLLTRDEIDALRRRVDRLGQDARLPEPSRSWPAIPWPAI